MLQEVARLRLSQQPCLGFGHELVKLRNREHSECSVIEKWSEVFVVWNICTINKVDQRLQQVLRIKTSVCPEELTCLLPCESFFTQPDFLFLLSAPGCFCHSTLCEWVSEWGERISQSDSVLGQWLDRVLVTPPPHVATLSCSNPNVAVVHDNVCVANCSWEQVPGVKSYYSSNETVCVLW